MAIKAIFVGINKHLGISIPIVSPTVVRLLEKSFRSKSTI